MKRKLIDFEVFNKIREESLSMAETELMEAEDVLAQALNTDGLHLYCFGESDVTYEAPDKSYIHATYQINNKSLLFENIEELIVDEQTSKKEARKLLATMVEELLNNDQPKAGNAFASYLSLPTVRRSLLEGKVDFWIEKPSGKPHKKRGPQPPEVVEKRKLARKRSQSLLTDAEKKAAKEKRKQLKARFGSKVRVHGRFKEEPKFQVKCNKKMFKEWSNLVENVNNYIDYQEFGPVANQSEVKRDERGNIVALKIPTSTVRNEHKLLNLTYKHMLDTELKVLRGKMKTVHEDTSFCRAMQDLRKCNATSNAQELQDVLEAVATRWPELLYLSQSELAEQISQALESIGESNYDDQICDFMAEGILRTAAHAYADRVAKVAQLAGAELDKENVYESFQALVHKFYPKLDEVTQLEMQVFVDLYNSLVDVHEAARNDGNEVLCEEVSEYLRDLQSVLKLESEPTLELAAEVAGWLAALVESNVPGAEETWDVSNTPHQTEVGDHPRMAWCAKQGEAVPSKFPGDWGGKLPVSDGKSYKGGLEDEMRDRAWGNWSSEETWPGLKNPYVPKPFGDYKMKEPSAVDDGQSDWSRFQNKDTWPALQNPYVPDSVLGRKAMTPQNYKAKSDNLVVDK